MRVNKGLTKVTDDFSRRGPLVVAEYGPGDRLAAEVATQRGALLLVTNDGMKSRLLLVCLIARRSIRDHSRLTRTVYCHYHLSSSVISAVDTSILRKEHDDPK